MGIIKTFFSYSRTDSEFVIKLGQDLRSEGANVWLDQLDIGPGERWDLSIEKALGASTRMLVIISPDSIASHNVMDEVSYALEEGKKVIPILLKPCKIPFRIRRLQHIDFTQDYDKAFKELIKALDLSEEESLPPDEAVTEKGVADKKPGDKEEAKQRIDEDEKSKKEDKEQEKSIVQETTGVSHISKKDQDHKVDSAGSESSGKQVSKPSQVIAGEKKKSKLPLFIGLGVIALLIVIGIISYTGTTSEDLEDSAWQDVLRENTIQSYNAFLIDYPDGFYLNAAQDSILSITDQSDWGSALSTNTNEAYVEYLNLHENGKWAAEAEQAIAKLDQTGDETSNPKDNTQKEAEGKKQQEEQQRLTEEDTAWSTALSINTSDAYNNYLNDYSNGRYRSEANNKIAALTKLPPKPVKHFMKSGAKLKAWNVKWALFTDGNQNPLGYFVQRGEKKWVETSTDRNEERFFFEETNRDEWSVILYDAGRQVTIQLDMFRMEVFYTDAKNPKRVQFIIGDYGEE